jgi:4'-phosphopantetheinyl transferase
MSASSFSSLNPLLTPHLERDHVHIWYATITPFSFANDKVLIDKYKALLSPDELTKAAAFKFEKDQLQSIFSRGILRHLLGAYLGVEPRSIQFKYNAAGKPLLDELGFNVSHSQGKVIIAVAKEQEVGIDIEYHRPLSDLDSMIRLILSDAEKNEFLTFSTEERLTIFYEFWAHKEAYLKAIGEGLGRSLKEAEFCILKNKNLQLTHVARDASAIHNWSVFSLAVARDFAAALFIKQKGWKLKMQEWRLNAIEEAFPGNWHSLAIGPENNLG